MQEEGPVHVCVVTAEFFIPRSESLKEKRMVLRRLRDRARNEFNVSAAEVGFQDKWQRSQWAFAMVNSDRIYLEGEAQKLLEFLRAGRDADLADYQIEYY